MATVTTLWRGNSTTICNTTEHAEARTTCQNPVWDPGTAGRLQSPLLARMSWPGLLHRLEELRLHIGAALNIGATKEEVAEVIFQMMTYGGVPTTVEGLKICKAVLE